jgi:Putative  PD-(D/E)XK family member, (DUF4420)
MPIRNAWTKLGSTADEPVAGLLVLRLCPESKLDVFAAIEPRSDHRLLLLKSKVPPIQRLENLPEGLGFKLQFVETAGDADGIHSLRFELMDFAYADVFDVVADDVLENIIRCSDSVEAFDVFAGRIADWQAFLNTLPSTGLSDQHQRGLFAELKFMRDVLLETCGPEKAVAAWAGPKALAKDFQFPQFAFEVKATTTKEPTRFRISNEIQLESLKDCRLFIFGCIFERVLSGGESLPELVKVLRDLLRPHGLASARFGQLLFQSGYLDAHAQHYDARFKTRAQHFFKVEGDFPRIIGADLRRGVGDVQYSVLLSECRRFEVSEADIRGMLGEIKK